MTTIAYRDGVLAGDTRVTKGDAIQPEHVRKVFKLPGGRLFAAAGNQEACRAVMLATRKREPVPTTDEYGCEAILVEPDGRVMIYEGQGWVETKAPYVVLGTGSEAAAGALEMHADAKQAVKIGMKRDKNSGGKVQSVTILPKTGHRIMMPAKGMKA